jgi:hypothetical protein
MKVTYHKDGKVRVDGVLVATWKRSSLPAWMAPAEWTFRDVYTNKLHRTTAPRRSFDLTAQAILARVLKENEAMTKGGGPKLLRELFMLKLRKD